jgi:hypothetical protein
VERYLDHVVGRFGGDEGGGGGVGAGFVATLAAPRGLAVSGSRITSSARPIGQAANEAAFFKAEINRWTPDFDFRSRASFISSNEGNAGFFQPVLNESEKFVLLSRQHRPDSRVMMFTSL